MSVYASMECVSGLMDQLTEAIRDRDALKAEVERLRAKNDEMSAELGCIHVILALAPGEDLANEPESATCAKVLDRQKQFLTLKNEVGRLKMLSRDPDDILLLRQQQQRVIDLTAEIERLRKALDELVVAADCIRHWHDAMPDNSGMVVSSEHVRKLWEVRDLARAALGEGRKRAEVRG